MGRRQGPTRVHGPGRRQSLEFGPFPDLLRSTGEVVPSVVVRPPTQEPRCLLRTLENFPTRILVGVVVIPLTLLHMVIWRVGEVVPKVKRFKGR